MILYYGGKQNIAKWIISNFPKDYEKMQYVEPYIGGGAVWFNKKPSDIEVLNDIHENLVTFYKVVKKDYKSVEQLARQTLMTQKKLNEYMDIYKGKKKASDLEIALSVIALNAYSFAAGFDSITLNSAGYWRKTDNNLRKSNWYLLKNTINRLNILANRLAKCGLHNRCALKEIKTFDSNKTLFYLDPPYPETNTNPYKEKNNTTKHFKNLLQVLKTIKGKFLLSCYEKDWMSLDPAWEKVYKKTRTRCTPTSYKPKKVECLIKNY